MPEQNGTEDRIIGDRRDRGRFRRDRETLRGGAVARVLENISELAADLSWGSTFYCNVRLAGRFRSHASAGANSGNDVALVGEPVISGENGVARHS